MVGIPWLRELGVIPLGGLQGPKGLEDLLRTKGGSKVQWREKRAPMITASFINVLRYKMLSLKEQYFFLFAEYLYIGIFMVV